MPRIIDLSQQLTPSSLAYPGTQPIYQVKQLDIGDPDARVSRFTTFDLHGGTHMDAPLHFDPQGTSIDEVALQTIPLLVVEVEGQVVNQESVPRDCAGMAVLFSTGWHRHAGTANYYKGFPYISPDAARALVAASVGLVGIDSPSVDGLESSTYTTHKVLCGAGIPIVEGLVHLDRLRNLEGDIRFAAFPLALQGLEASPVRAVAMLMDR